MQLRIHAEHKEKEKTAKRGKLFNLADSAFFPLKAFATNRCQIWIDQISVEK